MERTSEWLSSFNSGYHKQIDAIVSTKKSKSKNVTTIAITGGKGGVGKTSVAIKVSKELASRGHKTLLIDCDYNLSNTAIKLGLPVDNTFYSLVSAEKNFKDCLYNEGNFYLLSACNGSLDLFDGNLRIEEMIIDIINTHGKEFDFILLDSPAGLMRESLTLNAYCDKRIVVVTPDRSSITDSYSLVKVLSKKFGINENHLLVNKVQSKTQFEKVVKTFSETIENFLGCRTKILGGVKNFTIETAQFDDFLLRSGKNDLHKSFFKIVKNITDELSESTIKEGNPSSESSDLFEQEVH